MDRYIIFIYRHFFDPDWKIKQKENIIVIENYVGWPDHIVQIRYIVDKCISDEGPVRFVRKN